MGSSVSILFFPAIILTAIYGGYGPSLVATVAATAALAFWFVPPYGSFDIGADDLIRLAVFGVVAVATASLSARRMRAEQSQDESFRGLQSTLQTMTKVSGWPLFVGETLEGGAHRALAHAAHVVGCDEAVAVWEAEDEPWVYLVSSSIGSALIKRAPDDRAVLLDEHQARFEASAPFQVEHVEGQAFFRGVPRAPELNPLLKLVAREIGNSLDQLTVHDRLRQLAVREDRIRVARDLHDGVLQALTGIRLQLQALADDETSSSAASDRLLALERAIAIEQRELRVFIEGLKPVDRSADSPRGALSRQLEELRERIGVEWETPIAVRVDPADLALPRAAAEPVVLMINEAIVNALKHAHATRVSVDVAASEDGGIRVLVSDDGRGFAFRGRRDHDDLVSSGAGPVSLRERVVSLGGRLSIDSATSGSRVEITLPAPAGTGVPAK
jgi:signal transduction histidine kinase